MFTVPGIDKETIGALSEILERSAFNEAALKALVYLAIYQSYCPSTEGAKLEPRPYSSGGIQTLQSLGLAKVETCQEGLNKGCQFEYLTKSGSLLVQFLQDWKK